MENTQNGADSANQATVNGVKQAPPKKHHKIRKPRRGAFLGIAGVAVLVAGLATAGYLFVYKPANNYAIKVESMTVSKEDYAEYKKVYKKYTQTPIASDKDLKEYVINGLKYSLAIKEIDESITQEQIKDYVQNNFEAKPNKWLEFVAKAELSKVIVQNTDGGNTYALYTLPFCRSFVLDRTTAEGYGDEAQIEADRKYAEDKANAYMKAIAGNPSSALARKHVEEIMNDEKLDYGFAQNQSSVFRLTKNGKQFESVENVRMMNPEMITVMEALSDSSPISELLTEKRPVSVIEKYASPDTPIAYYFLAKLSDKPINFNYDEFAKNLEVKVNV